MKIVAGCDEAGRGPLAGDVVAAAVILPEKHGLIGLDDSKKLSQKKREHLFDEIQSKSKSYCIARASVEEIDSLNILHASLLAMKRAVEGLELTPEHVYVDGNKLPDWHYSSSAVVNGDSLIAEISAASILAKVTRDREMLVMEECFPGYGFAQHKGYPTKQHLAALETLGPCDIHRRSYGPVQRIVGKISGD